MSVFQLLSSGLTYTIRKSVRVKCRKIVVHPHKIEVVIPHRASYAQAQQLIEKKHSWVQKQWQKMQAMPKLLPATLRHDSTLIYQGKTFLLALSEGKVAIPECHLETDVIRILLPYFFPAAKVQKTIQEILQQWLIRKLHEKIVSYMRLHAPLLKVEAKEVIIKPYRSRWGSCNRKKTIAINFSLAFVPPEVLEYVVVHELCHLRHMDHSKAFWKLVASRIPDYRNHQQWLKRHHDIIHYFPYQSS